MQGKKVFLDQEVARFRLSERVPPHNLYRRLAELVDWTFLYDETRALDRHTGQPLLDPVVFFKLLLVGRLEKFGQRPPPARALRLDILFLLGYEVDEELPWHSTVSRTRLAHSSMPGAEHEKARLLSNKTHYSPTDPDARISIKPGKARWRRNRHSEAPTWAIQKRLISI